LCDGNSETFLQLCAAVGNGIKPGTGRVDEFVLRMKLEGGAPDGGTVRAVFAVNRVSVTLPWMQEACMEDGKSRKNRRNSRKRNPMRAVVR